MAHGGTETAEAMSDASLDDLLALARREFGPVRFEEIRLGGAEFDVLQVADMPAYLDRLAGRTRPGESVNLPLWAKIWPSSLVMGSYCLCCRVDEGAEILEIGAGIGLCGLASAARGYKVLLTDNEPHAVLFARINILKNELSDRASAVLADFTSTDLGRRFGMIVGCEILYNERDYEPLAGFLARHIDDAPGAEIVLALEKKRGGRKFFELAEKRFDIAVKEVPCRDPESGEETISRLFRLGAKRK